MTAINFPASPNPGDKWPTTGNIDGKVWAWDGTTWKIVSTNGTVTIIDNTARSFAFTVTYTNVPGSYNVVGTDRNGEVDGLNPTITVNEEDTLIFNVNASGHPFYLVWQHGGSSNQVGGGQGTNTASNQGTVNGTVTWVTDVGDGDALPTGELFYYQCGTHPAMYGTIKVLLKNTSDSATHIHDLIDLDDTPNAYDDGKYLRSTVTGTEWATVSGGGTDTTYEIKALDNNDDVNIQIDASSGTDSSVKIKSGNNITLDYINAGEFEISATGEENVQSDWTQATTTADDYIKNKPGVFQGTDSGLVPASSSGTTDKFLRSNGTWHLVSSGGGADGNDYVTGVSLGTGADAKVLTLSFVDTSLNETVDLSPIDTTYGAPTTSAAGLVPQLPASNQNNQYLRGDGSWQTVSTGSADGNDYVTNLSLSGTTLKAEFATSSLDQTINLATTTSAAGLLPQLPASNQNNVYLRGDGSWQTVSTGSGETNQNAFSKIVVSGQSDVDAETTTDTLTFVADGGMTITTNSGNDSVTFNSVTYGSPTTAEAGLVPQLPASNQNNVYLRGDGSWQTVSTSGEANQNAFSKIEVNNQDDVEAETATDKVTFVASGGMTITTNGSNDSVTFDSDDTTYGAPTTSEAGLVPQLPASNQNNVYLRGDGSWQTVSAGEANQNAFSNISVSGQSTVAADNKTDTVTFVANGAMSITTNSSSDQITFTSTNTTYNDFTGSSRGLVPNGSSAGSDKFLRSDGSWADVSSGTTLPTPNVNGAVLVYQNGWEWSRTALIDGGTSSNNTNLVVHANPNGYGGMEILTTGEILLKKAGTSYREGGHLQFEDQSYGGGNSDTFAIDVYSDDGSNNKCCIRVIDQETNTQRFSVNHDGAWGIGHTNPDYGQIGEVMVSRGSTLPPVWGNHGDITGSVFASSAQGATADTANAEIDHIYSQLIAIGNDDTITTVAELKTALLSLVRN